MSSIANGLAAQISGQSAFIEAKQALFEAYIHHIIGEEPEFDRETLQKLVTSAQALSLAEDEKHQSEGAILLSMILDVFGEKYPEIPLIARNLFANSGDFPNIELLTKRYGDQNSQLSFFTEAQISYREAANTVDALPFPLTDYQRALWLSLVSDEDVVTSAPTSAGKTHIILNYIVRSVAEHEQAFAAIIVPTRALISEVAGKVYDLLSADFADQHVEICTVPRDDGDFAERTIFVMTQERLHELALRGDIVFNYLFIDEAQNISDKNRGVLLHMTIERILLDESIAPQVIISMPSQAYKNTFSSIFRDADFKRLLTKKSPVSKIIMSVVPEGRNLTLTMHGSSQSTSIKKGFTGSDLENIVYRLGSGESNIIYRNQTDHCENAAKKLAGILPATEVPEALEEAAGYIEEFIHEEFTLAGNLRKGVAFHYGPLPTSVRLMVEDLARKGAIKNIVCTSTLAEGVNLPAKNLFMKNPGLSIPTKGLQRLEEVKVNNITGRAGRMLQHFSGNIFLVDPASWTYQDYFDGDEPEEKIPTYFQSLNDEYLLVMNALMGHVDEEIEDPYRLYTIANKLMKEVSEENIGQTLEAPEVTLSREQKTSLKKAVEAALENMKVARFTLEANPNVGYIQQNQLFDFLNKQKNYAEWALPHPKSAAFYNTLLRVCEEMLRAGVYRPSRNMTLEHICVVTKGWVVGDNLKNIIVEKVEYDRDQARKNGEKQPDVNSSVRTVIKLINNDIRFRLSGALKCYQTILQNVLAAKNEDINSVALHGFVEVGACEQRLVNMIDFGLTREAAVDIHEHLAAEVEIESVSDLLLLERDGALVSAHTVTLKELRSLFSENDN